jgi:hypothetical protein
MRVSWPGECRRSRPVVVVVVRAFNSAGHPHPALLYRSRSDVTTVADEKLLQNCEITPNMLACPRPPSSSAGATRCVTRGNCHSSRLRDAAMGAEEVCFAGQQNGLINLMFPAAPGASNRIGTWVHRNSICDDWRVTTS